MRIPKLAHTIDRFNQGCSFFQRAVAAWHNGDLPGYETALRKAATEAIGSLEWSLKIYLRSVVRDSITAEDIPRLKQPNFDDLMALMQEYAQPPLDSDLVRRLYSYRELFRNAPEHDAAIPPSTELLEAITTVRQIIVTYLPVLESQVETVSLSVKSVDALGPANLAQQMRSWFETLGYGFEGHSERSEQHFEWIINIPARRGYDRVLVRGVQGEAGLSDLESVRDAVTQTRVKEAWLISASRVSQAAREATNSATFPNLFCYTFDELLEESADFSGYLAWLEEEIRQRGIDRLYIPLACIKHEVRRSTGETVGRSRYDERNGWIDGYIDRWLDDPAKEHISVLGEFGTGKTWFALHYAWTALKRYQEAKTRGIKRPRLPLVIPLRDYAKAVSIESLFSEFFFQKYEIPLRGYSVFEQLNRMGKLLLIFDGFDEMASRIDRQKMINNFWELARVVVPGSKVILTCRTEHFPHAKEGRDLLNAELKASTANLTGEAPQFEILELQPLERKQIVRLLRARTDATTVARIMRNPLLLDLATRPVMAELVIEALPSIQAGAPIDLSRVYLYAIRTKMQRDIKAERTFTSLADKLYFLCELSWEMLSTDQMSINYRDFPDRIRSLFGRAVQGQKDLDHWHYDMMGQTLLIRNEDGDYSPAHRSLLEFFVAYKFAAELGILADDFAEMAKSQSRIDAGSPARNYSWSSYFRREIGEDGTVKVMPPLAGFVPENTDQLANSFGQIPLTTAVIDLMRSMVLSDQAEVSRQLLLLMQATQGSAPEDVRLLGGNAVTLLVDLYPSALQGRDLSYARLDGFQILSQQVDREETADLSHAKFCGASLQNADLSNAKLGKADFRSANLHGLQFWITQFDDLALDPSGEQLAVSSYRDILLWRIGSRSLIRRLDAEGSWAVRYSPDGKYLISSSWGGFHVRDPQTLEIICSLFHSAVPQSVGDALRKEDRGNLWNTAFAFSPSSELLYVGCNNSAVYIWDLAKRQELGMLLGHTGCIESVSLSPDETLLLSAGYKELVTWDLASKSKIAELPWKDVCLGNALFHPKQSLAVVAAGEQGVLVLEPLSLRITGSIHFEQDPKRVAFNHEGSLLGVGSYGLFGLVDYETRREVFRVNLRSISEREYRPADVRAISFDHSNDHIFVACGDGFVAVIDLHTGQVDDILWHLPDVTGADFRQAVGLKLDLVKRLGALGAIVE